jgi:hypothetical protein
MNYRQRSHSTQFNIVLKSTILCLALTWIVGCQSMITARKAKQKEMLAKEQFSCGEPLPGKIRSSAQPKE